MAEDILDVNVTINGKVRIIISTDSDLGKEILKRKFSKIEVTNSAINLGDRVIPVGSIVVTEE